MAEEEEPKKKSGIITIVIFVVAGFILVAIGLAVGFLVFGGAQGNPQDIANEIVTKQNEAKGSPNEHFGAHVLFTISRATCFALSNVFINTGRKPS